MTAGDSGHSEMKRQISLAEAVMRCLGQIWRDKILHLETNIRLYQDLFLFFLLVLLYATEIWTVDTPGH